MAKRDPKAPIPQPAEDMFGRPTSPRDEDAPGPSREAQGEGKLPASERPAPRTRIDDDDEEAEKERAFGGVGELPDGDGVRSSRGTNPLPETYWSAYPNQKPETD